MDDPRIGRPRARRTLPMLSLLLALVPACRQDAPKAGWPQPDVRSPAGAFTAQVRKLPGQERVPDVVARWQVRVVESGSERLAWSTPFPYRGEERHFLLTDDGRAFVHVAERFEGARPIVRIAREAGVLERTGDELRVPFGAIVRKPEGRWWLAQTPEPVRLEWLHGAFGPAPVAALALSDGRVLHVELEGGDTVAEGFPHPVPRVEPPARTLVGMEPALVRELQAPAFARAGEPLTLELRGDLRTPAWRLSGFRLEREGDLLVVVPMAERRAVAPGPGVHEPYDARPVLHELPAGAWRVVAKGLADERTPEQRVEVLPRGLLLRLRISGGFAGVSQQVDAYEQGVVHGAFFGPARWRGLTPAELRSLEAPLQSLRAPAPTRTPGSADLFHYELGWWQDDAWVRTTFDDTSIPPALGPLLERLRALLE